MSKCIAYIEFCKHKYFKASFYYNILSHEHNNLDVELLQMFVVVNLR